MKKRYIAYVALVLFGIGASVLFPRIHEKWTVGPGAGNELILALKGTSAGIESPRLEIRCDGRKSEVRLYMKIGIKPAFGGPAEGPAEMGLKEEFQDKDRNPLPAGDEHYGNIWTTDPSQTFAVKQDPLSFIERIMGKDWLTIRGFAYSDTPSGFSIDFPVMDLTDYRDRIASSCRDG